MRVNDGASNKRREIMAGIDRFDYQWLSLEFFSLEIGRSQATFLLDTKSVKFDEVFPHQSK